MNLDYFYTFLQTCLIEFPFYYYFLRPKLGFTKSILAVFAVNALTHPIVFFCLTTLKINYLADILIAEPFAFGVEAFALCYFLRMNPRKALLASTAANFASWQLGSIFTYVIFYK